MAQLIPLITLVAAVVLVTYQIVRRRCHREMETAGREIVDVKTALATAKADFEARQQELRFVIGEARKREDEAKARGKECEVQLSELEGRLRSALEEKGRLQNEATRVEENEVDARGGVIPAAAEFSASIRANTLE